MILFLLDGCLNVSDRCAPNNYIKLVETTEVLIVPYLINLQLCYSQLIWVDVCMLRLYRFDNPTYAKGQGGVLFLLVQSKLDWTLRPVVQKLNAGELSRRLEHEIEERMEVAEEMKYVCPDMFNAYESQKTGGQEVTGQNIGV